MKAVKRKGFINQGLHYIGRKHLSPKSKYQPRGHLKARTIGIIFQCASVYIVWLKYIRNTPKLSSDCKPTVLSEGQPQATGRRAEESEKSICSGFEIRRRSF